MAIRFGTVDSSISLFFAFFVNASILIVAAAAFHYGSQANMGVAYISDAYNLIAPAVRSGPGLGLRLGLGLGLGLGLYQPPLHRRYARV